MGHEIVGQAGEQGAAGQPAMAAGAEGAIGPGLKGIEGTFEAEAFDEKAKRYKVIGQAAKEKAAPKVGG